MTRIVVKKKIKLVKKKIIFVRMKGSIVMLGIIKGHEIFKATTRKIAKPEFTAKLVGDPDEIRANAMEALASHGVVYGLRNKQKETVSLYCFKKVLLDDNKTKRLVLTANYSAEGMEETDAEFVENLRAEMIDMIIFTGVSEVEWAGVIIDKNDVEKAADKGGEGGGMMWIVLGIVFWLCMDMPLIGIVFFMLGAGKIFSNVDWNKGVITLKSDKDNSEEKKDEL